MKKFTQKAKKFLFKKFSLSRTNERYIATPALKTVMQPLKTDFLLIVVVFNAFELIRLQWHSLKKLTDAYDYLVVDDSSDADQAKAIESFCAERAISYIHLPKNNPGLDPSLSHGLALNWIFYNVVKKLNPEYFGMLESDVLVARPGSFLAPWKGKSFWGMKGPSLSPGLSREMQEKFWRLWPGWCFFSRDFYRDKVFNFLPIKYIDTAGGNWHFLKDMPTDHLILWESVEHRKISETDTVQFFGNIAHLGAMSSKSDDGGKRNKKREFAETLAFGDQPPSISHN